MPLLLVLVKMLGLMLMLLLFPLTLPLLVLLGILDIFLSLQGQRPPPLSGLFWGLVLSLPRRVRFPGQGRCFGAYIQSKSVFVFGVSGTVVCSSDVCNSPGPSCGSTPPGGPRLVTLRSTSKAAAIFSSWISYSSLLRL